MRFAVFILLLFIQTQLLAQRGFAFTHFSTADGMGLASNMVGSLYQDEKGFIWVGTANGLQRFDGSKFIQFGSSKKGSDEMPHANIYQIIAADSGRMILAMRNIGEVGLFDPSDFSYTKIKVETTHPMPARAEYRIWKISDGSIYMTVLHFGVLKYNYSSKSFVETTQFTTPHHWDIYLTAVYEDVAKKQIWLGTDSGVCIYDKISGQVWSRYNNPKHLAILDNKLLRENVTQVYIDSERRTWIFGWPSWNLYNQYKLCFDSTGKPLPADTAGLNSRLKGFTAYDHFFETKNNLWIYGAGVLYNYDKSSRRFNLNKSAVNNEQIGIDYNVVYQLIEDKDKSLWIATDKGIYYTSYGSGTMSVVNLLINDEKEAISTTDVAEMQNGDLWLTTRGNGIISFDDMLSRIPNDIYKTPPPAWWTPTDAADSKFVWSIYNDTIAGKVYLGCNYGVLLTYDIALHRTTYLKPPQCDNSNITYITRDARGNIWMATKSGRLVKFNNNFTSVFDAGTVINKIFIDRQQWLWLATNGKGLFALDTTGHVLQRYLAGGEGGGLYANTGKDIEQLNDSIIVYGAGALNFVNKRTKAVHLLRYEDGLPSNTVERLRMDRTGYLWVITLNGLCRYNSGNNRITTYGPKDGIVLGEQTNAADFESKRGYVIFTGANALLMFRPSVLTGSNTPVDVTITDFKIFNQFIPVDSLMQHPEIKLKSDQNSFSIYFASLSYIQRDKLTYYYKMDGVDKGWIKADRSYFVNYSLLPPGKYTFSIYCENIEGVASNNITSLNIYIRPPFWRTWWFLSTVLFLIAIAIYIVHQLRLNRILAVENLRHRVARDLHDDMGSTLSTINILSSMAKARMNTDPVRTGEYLSKISENSQRMMEAMDDIIWSIKPSNDSMQRIAARMREFATSVLEAKDIDLEFLIREDINEVKLNMEARRDFFLVFKEAVNNAAKYSGAAKVIVSVTMENGRLLLRVKDNGRGFDVNIVNDGNGLGNMRKRTDHMNGRLQILSKPGVGTTVTVAIPLFH